MKNIKNFFALVKQIFQILTREQRKKSIFVFVNILISAGLETLGVSIVVPFVMAIMSPQTLLQNQYVKLICEFVGIKTSSGLSLFLGLILILIFILKNAYLLLSTYIQIRFRYQIQKDLSAKMLDSYLKRPYSYFLQTNSAEILRGIGSDIGCVKDGIETVFTFASQAITLIMLGIYMMITDITLAMGILIASVVGMIIITIGFKNKVKEIGEKQRDANAAVSKISYETITGVKEILVSKKQENFIRKYNEIFEKSRMYNVSYSTIMAMPAKMIEVIFVIGIVLMVCLRIAQGLDATAFVPQLASFAVAGIRILPSMSIITSNIAALIFQKPGIEASYNNLQEVDMYVAKRESERINKTDSSVEQKGSSFKELKIDNISWAYAGTNKKVLNELSLSIRNGESIAFIGESGAGKSTLVDVILGLFRPQNGTVSVDETDIYTISDEWSKIISYVPQSVFLLDDTIRNNIAFGLAPEEIDDKRVWKALEQAQLSEFIKKQSQGLDTVVGERGVKFSGGQRQRVAIARALYDDPQILVLDEATAALDNETEEAVLEAIEALQGTKTLIIVAHRLTTIRKCDKIFEIKNGKAYLKKREEVLGM